MTVLDSDHDTSISDCSSPQIIMQTARSYLVFLMCNPDLERYTIRGFHVRSRRETGGTREVISPIPLKRFTFKGLLESEDRLPEPFGPTLTKSAYSCVQWLQQNKIEESNAAWDCAAGWHYYTWASGDLYHWLKQRPSALLRGPVDRICLLFPFSSPCQGLWMDAEWRQEVAPRLGATASLSANLCLEEHIDSIWQNLW